MRLFQNSALYPSYLQHFDDLAAGAVSFDDRLRVFLDDRFGVLHFLQPVIDQSPDAFFTNANDKTLQTYWAREHGMASASAPEDILLAQIEHHRADVFYNLDPIRYSSSFVRKLPGCVRKAVCWRAAPSGGVDLSAYDAVVSNFPSILDDWRRKGCNVAPFFPAIDPLMDQYGRGDRPIDVLFVGGYSRHHSRRAAILERVAALAVRRNVVFCLDASRLTRLAETALGFLPPLKKHRRPRAISKIARPPVFGRQLYDLIGRSKIVLNGAIDMAGADRGNMRCFEAMGCGALLVSDDGRYPEAMEPGVTIATYGSPEEALTLIEERLADWDESSRIASLGRERVTAAYSKPLQWKSFVDLVGRL
ncbi:glycosyltransferase family 1 protein [Bradyrhizobium sp. AUGA SZCCT0274]|uniref:glycosyltransferase family protein n=1 Tax=Bradyrhizobium sp. AUGA SZCCT0274 TaxID=2807670 RepID=UPI001BA799E7|nr:glycosyltransferase [Bradyrhizobium sp. AUGA SZCCT0274]MBR1243010.1 glycosyltransferase family 1 protein [Bradyrhizobium sp. AUGA SZCCT0274]